MSEFRVRSDGACVPSSLVTDVISSASRNDLGNNCLLLYAISEQHLIIG